MSLMVIFKTVVIRSLSAPISTVCGLFARQARYRKIGKSFDDFKLFKEYHSPKFLYNF